MYRSADELSPSVDVLYTIYLAPRKGFLMLDRCSLNSLSREYSLG